MNTIDNDQMIKAVEKVSLHKYLHNLASATLRKVTLFACFPHTGAPNISEAVNIILVDDLLKIVQLNSGRFTN